MGVGLLSARGLIELISHAVADSLVMNPAATSCAEMSRGWRFLDTVDIWEQRGAASSLPLIAPHDWLSLDFTHPWFAEPLACDIEDLWPQSTARSERRPDRITLNRNSDHQRLNLDPKDQPRRD